MAGLLLRDIATYYSLRNNWKMLRHLYNWGDIDALLNENRGKSQVTISFTLSAAEIR